jgi:plasmid stabilization system protein ParE
MSYRVIVQPPAQADIEAAYLYIRERAPATADRWLDGLEKAIAELDRLPKRCGLARESKEFTEEIRQFLYGRGYWKYRILFVIRGKAVRVLHVRHGAQRAMRADEIESD